MKLFSRFSVVLSLLFSLVACDQPQLASLEPARAVSQSSSTASTKPTIVLAANLLAKNYYVIFDVSGSMSERACNDKSMTKSEAAKVALREFSRTVPADANLALLTFDGRGTAERVPLGVGVANRDAFAREVEIPSASGGTPLYSAMAIGYNRLMEQRERQLGYGEYHLVVVTDGEANPGQDPGRVVDAASKTSIVIHTVGFCIGSGHSLNRPGVTLYQEAGDLQSLRQGLRDVLAE